MPHLRERYLEVLIQKDLKWSRVVSVLGMRQCGKTTLLKLIASRYITLDDELLVSAFAKSDWTLIDSAQPTLAVDEVQLFPAIFSRIKMKADSVNRPGLFLLSGSVRFLSKKQIRESLTGRTSLLELLPMSIAECHNRPIKDFVSQALSKNSQGLIDHLQTAAWLQERELLHFQETGGMPGICFKRDREVRIRAWSAHLDTVLGRDLRLIYPTNIALSKLRELYRELALHEGEPLNLSALARGIGVSSPTMKRLLIAFEALFLIRWHGKTYYCEDLGLSSYAAGGYDRLGRQTQLSRFVYNEIKCQLKYLFPPDTRISEFRTRGGAYVPFVVEIPGRGTLAIGLETGDGATDKSLQSLSSFRKKHPGCKSVVIHRGKNGYVTASGVPCIPCTWIA